MSDSIKGFAHFFVSYADYQSATLHYDYVTKYD